MRLHCFQMNSRWPLLISNPHDGFAKAHKLLNNLQADWSQSKYKLLADAIGYTNEEEHIKRKLFKIRTSLGYASSYAR